MAYPAAFERQLRRGKSWVYIPMRWKGSHKSTVLTVSRLLLLAIAASGTALFVVHYLHRRQLWVVLPAVFILAVVAARLERLWTHLRYRQQEDVYYRLYDALHDRLEQEGKDYTEAQLRNLATYQHQQQLRKSEEASEFLPALNRESREAKQGRGSSASTPLMEA